jgi:hypothetical protein
LDGEKKKEKNCAMGESAGWLVAFEISRCSNDPDFNPDFFGFWGRRCWVLQKGAGVY